MKTLLLLLCLTAPSLGATSYHIGNSLTEDSLFWVFPDGIEFGYHIDYSQPLFNIWADPNGVDLSTPSNWPTSLLQQWDVVTLQPHQNGGSTLATDLSTIADFQGYGIPATEYYILQTWPGTVSWEPTGSYNNYWEASIPPGPNTPTLQRRAYFDRLMESLPGMWMVPTGEVMNALEQKGEDIASYYRDLWHLNNELGRYIATSTLLATIRHEHPRNVIPWALVDPNKVEIIQDTVWEVVTSSQWSGYSDFDRDGDIDNDDLTTWETSGRGGEDFLAWQRQVGLMPPPASIVPEPQSLILILLGIGFYARKIYSRRR